MTTGRFPLPIGAELDSFIWREYLRADKDTSEAFAEDVVSSGGGISASLPILSISSYVYSGTPTSTAVVSFISDGTIEASTTNFGTYYGGNWYSPTKTGIGSNYWIRVTKLSGGATVTGTTGSWLQLSSDRSYSISNSVEDTTITATLRYEIADDAGGSNILGEGRVTLSAKRSSLLEP